eukprot:TRINITY_DN2745_c0_g2_i11.p2 TRINITY_DN2745_c0_g2~~TRINITY_DN2745_c0_g2_i11.p2  ORF type:complete len:110 (+),score=29.67 TRINITY_DN2745_c0_g2_i11:350-679(+)
MRLHLQRHELEFEEEMRSREVRNEKQLAELRQEIDEKAKELKRIKNISEVLKRQLQMVRNEKEAMKADAGTLIKTATLMTSAELQFVHYQMYLALTKRMKSSAHVNYPC